MGPQIILDKSTLQSLSANELKFLSKHYYVNVAPVLVIEILADIKKYPEDRDKSEAMAITLARKLQTAGQIINAYYKDLAVGSLLGGQMSMDGRPVILDGQEFVDSRGDRGLFLEEQPEQEALRRWSEGVFSGTEELLAERWREIIKAIDLESFKNQVREVYSSSFRPNTIDELVAKAREILSNSGEQTRNFRWILSELQLDISIEQAIQKRWNICWPTTLQEFARDEQRNRK